jgi:hypothetical protein
VPQCQQRDADNEGSRPIPPNVRPHGETWAPALRGPGLLASPLARHEFNPLVRREMQVEIKLSPLALRVMTALIIESFIARAGRPV